MVEESIGEREREKFVEGLNSKVKLTLYKCFGREVQFKKYLHGLSDAGTRLLFKFRSGTHGLNDTAAFWYYYYCPRRDTGTAVGENKSISTLCKLFTQMLPCVNGFLKVLLSFDLRLACTNTLTDDLRCACVRRRGAE